MGAKIYIFFPFSFFLSVYVYAYVCDFVCIAFFYNLSWVLSVRFSVVVVVVFYLFFR